MAKPAAAAEATPSPQSLSPEQVVAADNMVSQARASGPASQPRNKGGRPKGSKDSRPRKRKAASNPSPSRPRKTAEERAQLDLLKACEKQLKTLGQVLDGTLQKGGADPVGGDKLDMWAASGAPVLAEHGDSVPYLAEILFASTTVMVFGPGFVQVGLQVYELMQERREERARLVQKREREQRDREQAAESLARAAS